MTGPARRAAWRARRAARAPRRGGRPRRRCAPRRRSAPRAPRRWRAGGRARWSAAARRSRGCARCRGSTCARSRARGRSARPTARATGTPPARRLRLRAALGHPVGEREGDRRVALVDHLERLGVPAPDELHEILVGEVGQRPSRPGATRAGGRRRSGRAPRASPAQQAAGLVARRVQHALGELRIRGGLARDDAAAGCARAGPRARHRRPCRSPRRRRARPSCAGRASADSSQASSSSAAISVSSSASPRGARRGPRAARRAPGRGAAAPRSPAVALVHVVRPPCACRRSPRAA